MVNARNPLFSYIIRYLQYHCKKNIVMTKGDGLKLSYLRYNCLKLILMNISVKHGTPTETFLISISKLDPS